VTSTGLYDPVAALQHSSHSEAGHLSASKAASSPASLPSPKAAGAASEAILDRIGIGGDRASGGTGKNPRGATSYFCFGSRLSTPQT
jgi:hypothetical protein